MTPWEKARIGDVAVTFDGPHATPKSTKIATGGPVFLGISSLNSGRLDFSQSSFLSEEDFVKWTRRVTPEEGDVVFSYETRLGEAAIIPEGFRGSLGRRLALMRPDPARVDSRFLLYYYLSPAFQEVIRQNTVQGSTVDRIMLREFPEFPIQLPPLDVQRTIAATLGALDDKIESNRRTVELAHTLMRSHYDAAPKRSVVASDVLTPVLGGTPKRDVPDYWDGSIKWASAKDVASAQGGFVIATAESISDAGVKSSAAKVMPAGTIVMTARGTVGALARLAEPMAFNQSCYGLRVNEGEEASLLVALEAAVARIKDAGHGTVFNTVNMATFDQIELEVPFSRDLDETLAGLSEVVLQRLKESRRLAALRDTLLPELLSGRIRVPAEGAAA